MRKTKTGDPFITNMFNDDIQLKLLRDTVKPEPALSFVVNRQVEGKTSNEFHLKYERRKQNSTTQSISLRTHNHNNKIEITSIAQWSL